MIQPLHRDWLECVELFDANGVEYLIVGAFAVAHHGRPRLTGHLDIWVKPGVENGQKVINALRDFGFASWAERSVGRFGNQVVSYLSRRHLIINKKSIGRAKDLGDVEELPGGHDSEFPPR